MQDPEKLREIEGLGEKSEEFPEESWEEPENKGSRGGVPLLQAAVCALALLALVFFKLTGDERYQEITEWYSSEMAQEIELPQLNRATAEPSPVPEPSPSATPSPVETDNAPLQML